MAICIILAGEQKYLTIGRNMLNGILRNLMTKTFSKLVFSAQKMTTKRLNGRHVWSNVRATKFPEADSLEQGL